MTIQTSHFRSSLEGYYVMQNQKNIFEQFANVPDFLHGMELLLNLSEESQSKLLGVYISSEYRNYYCVHSEKFAKILDLQIDEAHDIFHVFDFLAYRVLPKNEPEEIVQALISLKFDAEKSARLKTVLIKLCDSGTQNTLKNLDLIDDEIGAINPHLPRITYHIDQRLVLRDDKIIKTFPIVIMQFKTRHQNNNKVIFELTGDEIELLADQISAIKNQLAILENHYNQ